MILIPKDFQREAINHATTLLSDALQELSRLKRNDDFISQKNVVVSHKGYLLFEAPTGTGKTFMAGKTIEQISRNFKVIWLWFAPYTGLTEQAAQVIRTQFRFLRDKDISSDRTIEDLKSGDIFVTTWANVAVSNSETRKVRTNSEKMPAIDGLIEYARSQNYFIGVMIDEAHHSFKENTQALNFYQNVIKPDITILATATPKDKDIESFKEVNQIKNIHHVSISRDQGIKAGLIKKGIKVGVFKAQQNIENLIDFRSTALRCGVETHNEIKAILESIESGIKPLLLVQVDSNDESITTTKRWLKELGFNEDNIRTHTADEPDPHLAAIAHDETVEVLIFKMSVATGFDVPRAFTLVSMRNNRDADFGIQIVGRIMRVDRRLQVLSNLPEELHFGYVFLSNKESQTGLISAADRINQIKDELSPLSPSVDVVVLDNGVNFVVDGQVTLNISDTDLDRATRTEISTPNNLIPTENDDYSHGSKDFPITIVSPQGQLSIFFGGTTSFHVKEDKQHFRLENEDNSKNEGPNNNKVSLTHKHYYYGLRKDLDFPRKFKTAVFSLNSGSIITSIVERFRFDERVLVASQQNATKILMESIEIFASTKDRPKEINAILAQKEIDRLAQITLFESDKDGMIEVRSLHHELEKRLKKEFEQLGWIHMLKPETIRQSLHKILVLKPNVLKQATHEALREHIETIDTDELPAELICDNKLEPSRFNIYGVFPDDLNSWERALAEQLDNDLDGTIKWWHRNPVKKSYSVRIPIPGHPDFHPDFIIGVNGRTKGEGILLVEVKRIINDEKKNSQIKSQTDHPDYKKVMMLFWEDNERWMIVEYDEDKDKNILDRVFRLTHMKEY
ncbi:DEAD/DEAH box helicase [Brevibacillus daliensis]|uniref:DEAD/DEAH box helicase n=1 Tax=Brevibacillus daliensis TaxID=2892995 RepID=UPI001E61334E|nr:DEAD/DEAH box helicase family protein [Brevibacillus daliensis]